MDDNEAGELMGTRGFLRAVLWPAGRRVQWHVWSERAAHVNAVVADGMDADRQRLSHLQSVHGGRIFAVAAVCAVSEVRMAV